MIHLQHPHAQIAGFPPKQRAFKQSMSQIRVAIEWVLGDTISKKIKMIGLHAVANIYAPVC